MCPCWTTLRKIFQISSSNTFSIPLFHHLFKIILWLASTFHSRRCVFISLGQTSKREIVAPKVDIYFVLKGTAGPFFHVAVPFPTPTNNMKSSSAPQSHKHLWLFFLMLAILWYLPVALIWISPLPNGIQYVFMSLLALNNFSKKSLCKSFTHFKKLSCLPFVPWFSGADVYFGREVSNCFSCWEKKHMPLLSIPWNSPVNFSPRLCPDWKKQRSFQKL